MTYYVPGRYQPLITGDIIGPALTYDHPSPRRYRIMNKLGYSSNATVWLAQTKGLHAAFVTTTKLQRPREASLPAHTFKTLPTRFPVLINHFTLRGPDGSHSVLVTDVITSLLKFPQNHTPSWHTGITLPDLATHLRTPHVTLYFISSCNIAEFHNSISPPGALLRVKVFGFGSDTYAPAAQIELSARHRLAHLRWSSRTLHYQPSPARRPSRSRVDARYRRAAFPLLSIHELVRGCTFTYGFDMSALPGTMARLAGNIPQVWRECAWYAGLPPEKREVKPMVTEAWWERCGGALMR
ncbi:hypothetical protein DXG01_017095 [Tephrocybe rancida]|nr:hypothetical protein DXG01_017095 [Tephrocybe rancida]